MNGKRFDGLLEESPINVYPSLACKVGVNKAIILQQIHFLTKISEKANNQHNNVDGDWWVYNTYADWQAKYFPWLAAGTLKRLFIELETEKILISRQSPYNANDQTKWYRIDYDYWPQWFVTDIDTRHKKSPDPSQNVTPPVTKCANGYTENTTENIELSNDNSLHQPSSDGGGEPEKEIPTIHGYHAGDLVWVWFDDVRDHEQCTVIRETAKRVHFRRTGTEKPQCKSPQNVYRERPRWETYEDLTPAQQVVLKWVRDVKPGEGIPGDSKSYANTILKTLDIRFGPIKSIPTPQELDAAWAWDAKKHEGEVTKQPDKIPAMINAYRKTKATQNNTMHQGTTASQQGRDILLRRKGTEL